MDILISIIKFILSYIAPAGQLKRIPPFIWNMILLMVIMLVVEPSKYISSKGLMENGYRHQGIEKFGEKISLGQAFN